MQVILAILGILAYLVFDFLRCGPVWYFLFSHFSLFFYKHQTIGKALGIKYYRSDEWSTTREESKLALPSELQYVTGGSTFRLGHRDDINSLKLRQRKFTRQINLAPYVEEIVGKRITLAELESFLINTWIEELTEVYDLPLNAEEKERFTQVIAVVRQALVVFQNDILTAPLFLWKNWSLLQEMKTFKKKLDMPEQTILMTPFLTTIDSSMLNFAASSEPIKQFSELFQNTPVVFAPIYNKKEGFIILKLDGNNANNPGNSVFGPKGMICPGNTVTSMLMKSVADLKRQFLVEIDGKVELNAASSLNVIQNPKDVHVTFSRREAEELEAFDGKDAIANYTNEY